MTEAVVLLAPVRVAQNGVRLACLFEGILGRRVIRVAVGVILHCERTISSLDLVALRGTADFENHVIISLGHRFLECRRAA